MEREEKKATDNADNGTNDQIFFPLKKIKIKIKSLKKTFKCE